jgi:hypothetical protein
MLQFFVSGLLEQGLFVTQGRQAQVARVPTKPFVSGFWYLSPALYFAFESKLGKKVTLVEKNEV